MTCSEDGTLRLWDTMEVKQKTVIKPQLQKPGKINMPDGRGTPTCRLGIKWTRLFKNLSKGWLIPTGFGISK